MKTGNLYLLMLAPRPLKSLPPQSNFRSLITLKKWLKSQLSNFFMVFSSVLDLYLWFTSKSNFSLPGKNKYIYYAVRSSGLLLEPKLCKTCCSLLQKSNYLIALLLYNNDEIILRPPVTWFPMLLFIMQFSHIITSPLCALLCYSPLPYAIPVSWCAQLILRSGLVGTPSSSLKNAGAQRSMWKWP